MQPTSAAAIFTSHFVCAYSTFFPGKMMTGKKKALIECLSFCFPSITAFTFQKNATNTAQCLKTIQIKIMIGICFFLFAKKIFQIETFIKCFKTLCKKTMLFAQQW